LITLYFVEILSKEGQMMMLCAFVTATLDEGNGLASRYGRLYPCRHRTSLCRVANGTHKPGRPPSSVRYSDRYRQHLSNRFIGLAQLLLPDRQATRFRAPGENLQTRSYRMADGFGGLVVSMLASGSRVRGFKPGRSSWNFNEC
jgi:hypothetical protein